MAPQKYRQRGYMDSGKAKPTARRPREQRSKTDHRRAGYEQNGPQTNPGGPGHRPPEETRALRAGQLPQIDTAGLRSGPGKKGGSFAGIAAQSGFEDERRFGSELVGEEDRVVDGDAEQEDQPDPGG